MSTKANFFVAFPRGMGGFLRKELKELGLPQAKFQSLGCEISLELQDVWKLVYCSRIASRVLRKIHTFKCKTQDDFYDGLFELPWENLVPPTKTFSVSVSVSNSVFTHSEYVMHRFKDAIVDRVTYYKRERPSVDRDNPNIRLDLHMRNNVVHVSVLYSQGVMHRRGYRSEQMRAPLKENLASALVDLSHWDGTSSFIDPFCGSGTILIEAAMRATNTPAGFLLQDQGFENLPDFDIQKWINLKDEIDSKRIDLPKGMLKGGDMDGSALDTTYQNLKCFGWQDKVTLARGDFRVWNKDPNYGNGRTIVANPPYGERLESRELAKLKIMFADLGQWVSTEQNLKSALILPEDCRRWLGDVKVEFEQDIQNGKIDVQLIRCTSRSI